MNLIDRMAKAMAENNVLNQVIWDKLKEHEKDLWRSDARFALREVMNEITTILDERGSVKS